MSTDVIRAVAWAGLFCITLAFGADAQLVRNHEEEGGVRGFHSSGMGQRITRSFESDGEARAEFLRIFAAIGLGWMSARITLRASAETSNAAAFIGKDGERFVFYNASFMQKIKQKTNEHWTLVSILAHEVGHHLAYHTEVTGRDHEFELEADYFSGFVLRRLGASLDQSQAAMREISPKEVSPTHPGLDQRLQVITIGWTDGGSAEPPRGIKHVQNSVTGLQGALASPPKSETRAHANRIALVIGNGNYLHLPKLANAVLDATRVSTELEKRGFKVIRALNLNKDAMTRVVTEFEGTLAIVGGTGLFYYAGQSVFVGGEDVMLPIDAAIDEAQTTIVGGLNLTRLLKEIQSRTTTAMKDNGSAVLYAASKGEQALDGNPGGNSPFTAAFLSALAAEDDELSDTFRRLRGEVETAARALKHKQTPFFESSLDSRFYFGRPDRDPRSGITRILLFDSCRDNPFKQSVSAR